MSVYVDPCWEIYSLKNCVIDMILEVVFFRPYQTASGQQILITEQELSP